jgi:hypothetical protein
MVICFYLFGIFAGLINDRDPSSYHWVVEINYSPQYSTSIRFYKDSYQLVYEKKLKNVLIDIRRKKVRRKLDKMLKDYVRHPEKYTLTHTTNDQQAAGSYVQMSQLIP